MPQNITELKIALITNGMRSESGISKGRRVGAGPAGGRFVRFEDGTCVNVPLWPPYAKNSPFLLKDGKVFLNGSQLKNAELIPIPKFYSKLTSDNIPMYQIALIHGIDCIASTVVQTCVYWRNNTACQFCGIELSLQSGTTIPVKTPKQLHEVVGAAISENVCRHVILTIGSLPQPDKGTRIYSEITREIKKDYDIPIHVQLEPPAKVEYFEDLHEAGVDTVGIHIESFDKDVLRRICPGKISISLEKYKDAWKFAAQLFGEYQVDSYILVGLGESDESILEGSKQLLGLGVIPHVVPFRPIAGTPLENHLPPSPSRLISLFTKLAQLMRDFGANPTKCKAGCVRCGGCSPLTEAFKYL